MHDDLDLRVIEREHDADPRYREALRQRVAAILDASDAPPTYDGLHEPAMIDLDEQRVAEPDRHRRRWVLSAAALLGAAAVIAALVVIPSSDDSLSPANSVPATEPSVDETVGPTEPPVNATVPVIKPAPVNTPELFTDIAPGSMVELPESPISGRNEPAAIWTGTEMIVWGGMAYNPVTDNVDYFADGAAFNLADGTWRVIAPAPLSGRHYPAAVWTGTEMIVWGGFTGEDMRAYDGAAYDPATDTWRLIPEIPYTMMGGITILSMVWTGDEAAVVGGSVAAAYDPATNSWRRLAGPPDVGYPAIWTGDSIVLNSDELMRYDLAADSWTVVTARGIPGSYAELVAIPGADGLVSTFMALPAEIGTPVQILDRALTPIGELPPFPGDPSVFADTVGASAKWVGEETIFTIWHGVFPYEPSQVWALNPRTQTWRQLDDSVPEGLVVVSDVLLDWGRTNGPDGVTFGVAYRAGT